MPRLFSLCLFAAFLLATRGPLTAPALAQQYSAEKPLGAAAQSAPAYLKHAGISQNLNHTLPLNDHFVDSTGADRPLSAYFGDRPVILAMVYYKCRLLCPQVLQGMAASLRQTGFTAGDQYKILIASIDYSKNPADPPAAKQ